jgi:hypothetical protein
VAQTSPPAVTRSSMAPVAWWAIPAVIGALLVWKARR